MNEAVVMLGAYRDQIYTIKPDSRVSKWREG